MMEDELVKEVEKVVKEMERIINEKNAVGQEMKDIIDDIAYANRWKPLDIEPWDDILVDFFYRAFEWESNIDGSSGGLGLYYIRALNKIIYIVGDWYRATDTTILSYRLISVEELLKWIVKELRLETE